MFQQITLVGNIGKDAETRYLPSGKPLVSFSLATGRQWTDKTTGEKKEKTIWWNVTIWGDMGERLAQYLVKGARVLIVGEVEEPRVFQDNKTQEWRASMNVTAQNVRLIGSKGDMQGQSTAAAPSAPADDDSEIPF